MSEMNEIKKVAEALVEESARLLTLANELLKISGIEDKSISQIKSD